MRVYLAGPDVFLPDPLSRAARLKLRCAAHGLVGVSPLDALADEPPHWSTLPEALRIARRNEAHIASCDVLLANLTPFRGASADVGTVFELGFMRALARPVFGWSNSATDFASRTRGLHAVTGAVDADGMLIEDFGLGDNLMIDGAIAASGGVFIRRDCVPDQIWSDISAFESCLAAIRRL